MFTLRKRPERIHKKGDYIYEEPYLMDKVVKTGKEDTAFYVESDYYFKPGVDMRKKIRSFDSDVGVENTLRKVKASGENVDQVIASGRFASKQKGVVDAVNMPRTPGEIEAYSKVLDQQVTNIWRTLPEELKNHMSVDDFVKKYDKKWLDRLPRKEVKKEAKKEGE